MEILDKLRTALDKNILVYDADKSKPTTRLVYVAEACANRNFGKCGKLKYIYLDSECFDNIYFKYEILNKSERYKNVEIVICDYLDKIYKDMGGNIPSIRENVCLFEFENYCLLGAF